MARGPPPEHAAPGHRAGGQGHLGTGCPRSTARHRKHSPRGTRSPAQSPALSHTLTPSSCPLSRHTCGDAGNVKAENKRHPRTGRSRSLCAQRWPQSQGPAEGRGWGQGAGQTLAVTAPWWDIAQGQGLPRGTDVHTQPTQEQPLGSSCGTTAQPPASPALPQKPPAWPWSCCARGKCPFPGQGFGPAARPMAHPHLLVLGQHFWEA